MASFLRKKLVGGRTKRFQADRAMDCDYITDRVVAMSYPYSGVRSLLPDRNNISSVKSFLDTNHGNSYKIYNLCEKKGYKPSVFEGRVEECPISSVQAPNLQKIREVCKSMIAWLDADGTNVVVIHCEDGKSTTGLVSCSLLLSMGQCSTANEAMRLFARRRLNSNTDLFLQTHFRYANYFERILKENLRPPSILILSKIAVTQPKFKLKNPWFAVTANGKTLYYNQYTPDRQMLMFPCDMFLVDDICIEFYDGTLKNKVAHFSFNCSYVDSYYLGLQKRDIDVACLDKAHKVFPSAFEIQLSFLSPKDEFEAMKEMGIDMVSRTKSIEGSSSQKAATNAEELVASAAASGVVQELEVDWSKPTMQAIMGNATLAAEFYEFLKSQIAEESFEFYSECKSTYQPLGAKVDAAKVDRMKSGRVANDTEKENEAVLLTKAKMLFSQYLAKGAPYELNLDHIVKLNVENAVKNESLDKHTFDEAMASCFSLMAGDPFFKFLKSERWWRLARQKRPLSFASRFCASCRRPILPHDASMKVRETHFHWKCLRCDNCNATLRHQANCIIEEDRLSCPACNKQEFFSRCSGCQRMLVGDTVSIEGQTFHKDCCSCVVCDVLLASRPDAIIKEGRLLCGEHKDSKDVKDACCDAEGCRGSSDTFTAMGRRWCRSCFKCALCSRVIDVRKEEYVERDDTPICMDCEDPVDPAEEQEDACAVCNAVFSEKSEKVSEGAFSYHSGCMSCGLCSAVLKDNVTVNQRGLRFCSSHQCYKCEKDFSQGSLPPISAFDKFWHPDCFCCNVDGCGKFLTSEMTSVLVDRRAYCSSHVTSKCGVCSQPVLDCEDELCVLLGDDEKLPYHERCFTCDVCDKVISPDEQFSANIVNGNKLIFLCADHSSNHICASCGQPVTGEELVEAHGLQWHADCLSCALVECRQKHASPEEGELFNGNLYCASHFDHVCAVCHKFIINLDVELRLDVGDGELPYHEGCFQCIKCSVQFTEESDFVAQYDGEDLSFVCAYHEQLCSGCESNFSSPPVAAMDGLWHRECYRCSAAGCLLEFSVDSVVTRQEDGSLICTEHLGHSCAVCTKYVLNGEEELFLDLGDGEQVPYHESCFSCSECDSPLTEDTDFVAKLDGNRLSFACSYHTAQCSACSKPFTATPIAAFDTYWHHACFQCSVPYCAAPFDEATYHQMAVVQEDGSLLCAEHVGHLCAACDRYVKATEPELCIELSEELSVCCHEKCCACVECKVSLIEESAPDFITSFEDGKLEFKCSFHELQCVKCSEDFNEEPVLAFDLPWHRRCLVCSQCAKSHADASLATLQEDNTIICTEHTVAKCAICKDAMDGTDTLSLEVDGQVAEYHEACYRCHRCSSTFNEQSEVAVSFNCGELRLWCSFHDSTCFRCRRTFKDKAPITAHGKKWHAECCFCSYDGCGLPLQEVAEVEAHKGSLVCSSHLTSTCAVDGCGQSIKKGETALRFQDHLIHEACFACHVCKEVLQAAVGNYMIVPTSDPAVIRPQCSNHCDRCGKGIAQYALEAAGKQFHMECFTCFQCGSKMEGQFGIVDDEFLCANCI